MFIFVPFILFRANLISKHTLAGLVGHVKKKDIPGGERNKQREGTDEALKRMRWSARDAGERACLLDVLLDH